MQLWFLTSIPFQHFFFCFFFHFKFEHFRNNTKSHLNISFNFKKNSIAEQNNRNITIWLSLYVAVCLSISANKLTVFVALVGELFDIFLSLVNNSQCILNIPRWCSSFFFLFRYQSNDILHYSVYTSALMHFIRYTNNLFFLKRI